jgi:nucleoside-diphosphate-sugar epimerase
MADAAILGATGPTGIDLANILHGQRVAVRVVSRSAANLQRAFGEPAFEKVVEDVLDANAAMRAVDGCPLVYDCLGLPADQMHLHPAAARNIAKAVRATGARCIQVSSYWAYLPLQRSLLNEAHPRSGGPDWVRWRREAEDVLRDAGAAILHLPDFYGPDVHTSTLQSPLAEAAAGKIMNWIGAADTAREYILVPDAMEIAARIRNRDEAFGNDWILPGSGPLTGAQVAEIAGRHLDRPVKLRTAGVFMLRLVSLFSKDLRGFMQVVPDYVKPIAYDASRLEGLMGKPEMTSYEIGIARTLDAISERRQSGEGISRGA